MNKIVRIAHYIFFQILYFAVSSSQKAKAPNGFHRIYFVHIRKTGGTSVNNSILSMGDPQLGKTRYAQLIQNPIHNAFSHGRIFAAWDQRSIEMGSYYYAFSHIPFWSLELPKDTYIFTCLRDPVKRVLSHYRMLLDMSASSNPHPSFAEEGEWLGDSFEDFLDRCPREHLLNQLYMFSQNFDIDEAVCNIGACQIVLMTERLEEGLQKLEGDLDIPLLNLHVRKGGAKTEISDGAIYKLREILKPEYDFIARIPEVADLYANRS